MSLGGLIPIGGGGNGGGKKAASDLTGGLISISSGRSASAANDVDVSDFDIDDLLSDTLASGKKSKAASSKSRSSAPSPPLSSSDAAKDKKKSKEGKKKKDKDKKSKSSSKKSRDASEWSVGDDDDDRDAAKSRDWDRDSTDFAVPVKKSGALDAEFAKMLGLEDEMGSPSPSFDDDKAPSPSDTTNDIEDDTFKYTPTVRGGGGSASTNSRVESEAAKPLDDDKPVGGLSAAFFSDDAGGGESASLFSSLSSFSGERRGGRRGGRRGSDGGDGEEDAKPAARDPFASKTSDLFASKPTAPSSLDSLFGSARGSASGADDPFASRREARSGGEGESDPLANLLGKRETKGGRAEVVDQGKSPKVDDNPLPATKKLSTPPKGSSAKASSAQDDLLAELLAGDDKPKEQSREQQLREDLDDLGSGLEALGGGGRRGRSRRGQSEEHEKEAEATHKSSPTPKPADSPPVSRFDSSSREAVKTTTPVIKPQPSDAGNSARDSLLMDLLGDLPSPSKSKSAQSQSPPPLKEVVAQSSPPRENESTRRRRPSPVPSPPSLVRDKPAASQAKPTEPSLQDKTPAKESPPPSPGRARSLTTPTAAAVIKESDFEQSKDSLLEEILTPPPSAPVSPVAAERSGAAAVSDTGDSRGSSYSQSFDGEEAAISSPPRSPLRSAVEAPPMPSIPEDTVDEHTSKLPQQHSKAASTTGVASTASTAGTGPLDATPTTPAAHPPPVESVRSVESPATASSSAAAASAAASQVQVAAVAAAMTTAMAEAAAREHQLRVELQSLQASQCAWTQREQQLEAAKAELAQQVAALAHKLSGEQQRVQQLSAELSTATGHHSTCDQEKQALRTQVSTLQGERLAMQRELTALAALHGECGKQQALAASALEGVQTQLTLADERSRQLVRELTQEQRERQAAQLRWTQREQQEDRERELSRQRDKLQMDALFQQLQATLAHLQVSHGPAAADEQRLRAEVEGAARMRMLSTLEASSKAYAVRSEDECQRLAALLGALEGLLRGSRQELMDEKERLRQEQTRLDVLATHFQAQSAVLHERADANSQLLASQLAASLQDARTADARVATRRQQLEEHERALFQERAAFAAFREQAVEHHAREEQALAQQQRELEAQWRELADERADLDAIIAAHERDWQQLQLDAQAVEDDKRRVGERAEQVAQLAQRLERFTAQMVSRETAADEAVRATEARLERLAERERAVKDEHAALADRERRLHQQLRQLDQARGRLNEQRKQHLAAAGDRRRPRPSQSLKEKTGGGDADNDGVKRLLAGRRSGGDNQWEHRSAASPPTTPVESPPSRWELPDAASTDPSGLSPALRKLVEDNWRREQWRTGRDAASVRDERLRISCMGLDTSPIESGRWETHKATATSRSALGQREATRSEARGDVRAAIRAPPPLPPPPPSRSVCIDL